MYIRKGRVNRNAEITLDLTTKKAKFKYKEKDKGNYPYFIHWGVMILWIPGMIYVSLLLKSFAPIIDNAGVVYTIYTTTIYLLGLISVMYISGWISVGLHKTIPALQKSYPKTNALLHKTFAIRSRVKLKENNVLLNTITRGNQLIIMDYSIVYFEYSYTGKNKIIKFETKYTGQTAKYIAIFTFEKPITEGVFEYK